MIKIIRKILSLLWLSLVIFFVVTISQHREYLDPQNLHYFFQSFGSAALAVYIFVSFVRGIVLLPSLPLVLVGTLFFPTDPNLVFLISMIGIIFSGVLIYRFSDFMGFDEMFEKHSHNEKVRVAIEKYGFYTVLLWSFAPIVPTDLICYVAGTVQMNFWKFVIALAIGEGMIVGIIIYGGNTLIGKFLL